MTTPATRSGGTSASAELSAVNNRVPSFSPSACPASTTRVSRPGMRCSRSTRAARACSACWLRSPKFWLGLLSTITTATKDNGCRSSRVSDGLASASTMSASASARNAAPRLRARNSASTRITTAAMAAHKMGAPTSGANATPKFKRFLLLPQPLKQRRNMNLVGLVVAGERVHDDIDAGAERELALARFTVHHRQHRLAVRLHCPGSGQIVRSDQNGGHPVAAACRPGLLLLLVFGRECLDPKLPGVEPAGEVAQQIERLGQHVIARHRLKLGNVERGQNLAQLGHARAAGLSADARRRVDRIARVEQYRTAVL